MWLQAGGAERRSKVGVGEPVECLAAAKHLHCLAE